MRPADTTDVRGRPKTPWSIASVQHSRLSEKTKTMKAISEYVRQAMEDYDLHAWDQWDFRWSAERVAKAAAQRGEISRANVGFLTRRIIAEHAATEKAAKDRREAQVNAALAALENSPIWSAWTPEERAEATRLITQAHCPLAQIEEQVRKNIAHRRERELHARRKERAPIAEPLLEQLFTLQDREHTIRYEGTWISHEDSFGGLHGGDYEGAGEERSHAFRTELESLIDSSDFETAVAGLRSRIEAAKAEKDRELLRGGGWANCFHQARIQSEWGKEFVRKMTARSERERLRREKFTREQRERIRAAGEAAAAEEKRLRDIRTIRAKWRTIGTQSWYARSAHNGGRRGYHPDALALYDRIMAAQARADELRRAREERERAEDAERRTRAERAVAEAKEKEKQAFLSAGAWSALDKIKL